MSAETFTVELRPSKRDKDRPWVILMKMGVHKPIVVARCESEEMALEAAKFVGLTISARRAAATLDGFGDS